MKTYQLRPENKNQKVEDQEQVLEIGTLIKAINLLLNKMTMSVIMI